MRWTEKEDEIVVRFYLGHVSNWLQNMSDVMRRLRDAGFPLRDEGSTRMRIQNVEYLHTDGKRGLSNAAQQTVNVYNRLK